MASSEEEGAEDGAEDKADDDVIGAPGDLPKDRPGELGDFLEEGVVGCGEVVESRRFDGTDGPEHSLPLEGTDLGEVDSEGEQEEEEGDAAEASEPGVSEGVWFQADGMDGLSHGPPHLMIVSAIFMAAGPTSTTKTPGKMKRMRGIMILTAVLAARSSAS